MKKFVYNAVVGTKVADPWGGYNGQCVSLIKLVGSSTAATSAWKPGRSAWATKAVPIGTALATFSGTTYTGHVGFLCGYDAAGLVLCDQNYVASGAVAKHLIKYTGSGGVSDAGAYKEVLVAQ